MLILKRWDVIITAFLLLNGATITAMISFFTMTDDDTFIKQLQRDNKIPIFPIINEIEAESNTITSNHLAVQTINSNSDPSINLTLHIGRNSLKIVSRSILKEDSILDSDALATLYAMIIGYNSSHGTELAQSWPVWSLRAPESFSSCVKKYLSHPFLFNKFIAFEHAYVLSATDVTEEKNHTNLVSRCSHIFNSLLSSFLSTGLKHAANAENKRFVKSIATQLLQLDLSRRPELAAWDAECKKEIIRTLSAHSRGKKILKRIVVENPLVNQYVEGLVTLKPQ